MKGGMKQAGNTWRGWKFQLLWKNGLCTYKEFNIKNNS